jgi:hypothetical protein
MRVMQKEKLLPWAGRGNLELIWHESAYDVPQDPAVYSMAIAHEFFDALPVHVIKVDYLSCLLLFFQRGIIHLENAARLAGGPCIISRHRGTRSFQKS